MNTSPSRITAAEYGRLQDPPISKSGMSRLISRGLPVYEGQDDHGRMCKFVDPLEADRWRVIHCSPKIDGSGNLRGLPSVPATPSAGQRSTATPEAAPARPSGSPARSRPSTPRLRGGEGEGDPDGETSSDPMSISQRIAEARAQEAEDKAATSRLRRLKEEGSLVERKAAIEVVEEFAGMVGKSIDRMPVDNATLVAATLGVAEHDAYQALQAVAVKIRDDLARDCSTANEQARALGSPDAVGDLPGQDQAAG